MTFLINIPRPIAIFASQQLANIDYNIATRVSEDVSKIIQWSYNHDLPILAKVSINLFGCKYSITFVVSIPFSNNTSSHSASLIK